MLIEYHRACMAVACILPNIASDFGSSSLSWVGTAYLLTQTTFSPMYGRMSDVFGRKVSHSAHSFPASSK